MSPCSTTWVHQGAERGEAPPIDRLTGSDQVRLAIDGGRLPALLEQWDRAAAAFRDSSAALHLYQ